MNILQYVAESRARTLLRSVAVGALVLASALLAPTGSAVAAEITFDSVVGYWRDPVDTVPGSQPGDPVITNGDPVSTAIEWLRDAGASVQAIEVADLDLTGHMLASYGYEVAHLHRDRFGEAPETYGDEVAERIATTLDTTFEDYLVSLAWRRRLRGRRPAPACRPLAWLPPARWPGGTRRRGRGDRARP